MTASRQRGWLPLATLAFILVTCPHARAGLEISTQDLGGGLFQYDLTVVNQGVVNPLTMMPETLSGLNIIDGNSLFGLDSTSVIMAPQSIGGNPAASWDFFAPLPSFGIDELNFFSLDPAGDVPIGGSLAGFSFQSTTDPATLPSTGLVYGVDYDFIVSSGPQAVPVPEPATWVLALTGLLAALAKVRGNRAGSPQATAPALAPRGIIFCCNLVAIGFTDVRPGSRARDGSG